MKRFSGNEKSGKRTRRRRPPTEERQRLPRLPGAQRCRTTTVVLAKLKPQRTTKITRDERRRVATFGDKTKKNNRDVRTRVDTTVQIPPAQESAQQLREVWLALRDARSVKSICPSCLIVKSNVPPPPAGRVERADFTYGDHPSGKCEARRSGRPGTGRGILTQCLS